jgi:hypothetical protein
MTDYSPIIDAHSVAQLVLRERQSRDRGWWEEMADCFSPDAIIDMSWFTGPATEFIRHTRARSTDGVWGRHRLSPPSVRVKGDRAWAELPLGIEFRTTVGGLEADLVSYCRSQYRAQRLDDRWWMARITSIYEHDTLTPVISGQALSIEPTELAEYHPSYRFLSWYFAQQGAQLADDQLGDDLPDAVAGQYAIEADWLAQRRSR